MDFSKQKPLLNGKSVRILYFSDVHEWIPIPMVEAILKPLISQNDINLICIGGDLGNDKHDTRNDLHVNSAEICNEEIYEDLFLSKLASFKVPIIYVPGNHDSISFFHNKYADGKKGVFNIHNRVLEIAPNLYCLGVGGSCPAYDKSHNLIWKGFPNEETDIDCTISKQCIASIPENSSVIQFTHCPPSFAYSSQVCDKDKQLELEAGSENLTELYDSLCQSHDVILYMHGHCHHNFGSMLMNRSTSDTHVLSAGSIRNKYYSVISIRLVNEKWVVKNQSLHISSDF